MDCRLLDAVSKCAKFDEACAKCSARALYDCSEEVPMGLFRADLKCGEHYVEVEPAERWMQGVCRAAAWRAPYGVKSSALILGAPPEEAARLARRPSRYCT